MSMMSIMLNYYYGTSNHAPCVSNCTCAEGLHFIIVIGKMSIIIIMLFINPRRMRSEGYSSRSVCLSVCLFVCLSVCLSATILALQATRRLMSDTNSFSATRARKITWRFR